MTIQPDESNPIKTQRPAGYPDNIRITGAYINGKIIAGASGRYGEVFNPATGKVNSLVAFASQEEVNQAVAAAAAAFPNWANTPPLRRARILFRFKELLEQHGDELARYDWHLA